MNIKLNANFPILGQKAEKLLRNFLHLYNFMVYNEVWFSRSTFHKKAKKNLQAVLFCQCRSKALILAKIQIFYHAHLKCKTCFESCILTIFVRRFQKSKNIARIMSHSVTIWRNVNVTCFFAPDTWTYL